MEDKDRMPRYYLQDELGSPLRVLYGNGNGDIYGYDEFGGELYETPDPEKDAADRYSRQGEGQPFGYTGYRYDAVGGTYFAQAREYKAELGRFTAEDVVRGNGAVPKTLNRYGYCWSSPLDIIDIDGREPVSLEEFQIGKEWIFEADPVSAPLSTLLQDYQNQKKQNSNLEWPELFNPNTTIEKSITPSPEVTIGPVTGEYTPIVKKDNVINISVEVGAGLYAGFDVTGIGAELGGKSYLSFNNQGKYFSTVGGELAVGVDAFVIGGTAGCKYESYAELNQVIEEGWFLDYNLFGFNEKNGDIIFNIGASLYVAIGGGIEIEVNVSKAWRELKKGWKEFVDSFECSE